MKQALKYLFISAGAFILLGHVDGETSLLKNGPSGVATIVNSIYGRGKG